MVGSTRDFYPHINAGEINEVESNVSTVKGAWRV
jgi:hypothetical protein